MVIKLYIPFMIFLSGMISYAAIHHYTIDQRPGERRVHLLFAGISLVIVLFILSSVQIFQAQTVNEFIQANRLNLAVYALFIALLPWFFAEYAGLRSRAVLVGLTGLAAMLFLVNLIQPYTLLYKEIQGLARMNLPWGEEIIFPLATASTWFYIGVLGIFLDLAFGFYALVVRFRSDRRRTALFMMLALGLFAAGTVPGILFRLGIAYIPPLGSLGYMSMIIVMGLTLNYEIQENRRHMRAILDHVPAYIFMKDLKGQYIMINRHFEGLFHVSNAKMYGRTDHVLFPKEQADAMHADEQQALAIGHPLECEEIITTNGEPRTYISIKFPLFHADGTSFAICGISTDITRRKLAELALKQSEAKFQRLYNETPVMLHSIDRDARVVEVNDYWLKKMGYERNEVIGRKIIDFYSEASQKFAQEVTQPAFFRDGIVNDISYQFVKKNGDLMDVLLSATAERDAEGNIIRSQTVIEDITERKQTQASLHASEIKFRAIFENSRDAIGIAKNGVHYYANPTYLKLFGYDSNEEISGTSILNHIAPSHHQQMIQNIRYRTAGELAPSLYVTRGKKKDGTEFHMEVSASTFELQGEIYTVANIRDITERMLIEELLKRSEAKFTKLFMSSPVGMSVSRMDDGRLIDVNKEYERLSGYSRDELIDRTSVELGIWADAGTRDHMVHLLRTEGRVQDLKCRLIKKNGSIAILRFNAEPIEIDEVPCLLATLTDITEQLRAAEEKARLEDQLRQAQKMEAIGQLAGGVAHDFNNLLTIFGTYGGILGNKLKNDDVLRPYAERIVEATDKAAGLTQSLLAFSRKQTISLKSVDLNEIIRKVNHFLHRIIGEDIELKASLAGTKLTVMADSGQIEQVLMNLATNARDAMPRGGLLTINSEVVPMSDTDVKAGEVERAGMYARISVSDTGQGMDKSTLERIFEPFFTTKEVGKGTGLGLAIVYGIIKQHGGTVRVYSEPGKGTTFRIYLPLMQSATEKPTEKALPAPRGGDETILLVEDNAAVRESIKIILKDAGYNVIEAVDGEDALAEFNRHSDEIMLLLSDVIMPKMNGKEVYDAIRGIRPDLKALFISGYTADIITSKGLLNEELHLMYKPPDPDALKRKIREILDSRQG